MCSTLRDADFSQARRPLCGCDPDHIKHAKAPTGDGPRLRGHGQDQLAGAQNKNGSNVEMKWSCFLGQVCGLAKMHLVCVRTAFRITKWQKYAMSGVRLSRAV